MFSKRMHASPGHTDGYWLRWHVMQTAIDEMHQISSRPIEHFVFHNASFLIYPPK